jgi:multisubunit Na+/H+ antiporter MnhG subunit
VHGDFLFGLTRGDMWVIFTLICVVGTAIYIYINSGFEQGKVENRPSIKPLGYTVLAAFFAVMIAPPGHVQIIHAIKKKQIDGEIKELIAEGEEIAHRLTNGGEGIPNYDMYDLAYDTERTTEIFARIRLLQSRM